MPVSPSGLGSGRCEAQVAAECGRTACDSASTRSLARLSEIDTDVVPADGNVSWSDQRCNYAGAVPAQLDVHAEGGRRDNQFP